MHHSAATILAALAGPDDQCNAASPDAPFTHEPPHVVVLEAGDTAWDPASTSRIIGGPATVAYVQHPDGGVDARVSRRG